MRSFIEKWMPVNISTQGGQVDDLIVWTHWFMLALARMVWSAGDSVN